MELKKEKNKKIIMIGIISIIAIIVLTFFSLFIWYKVSISAVGKSEKKTMVEIEMGTTVTTIANTLKENELIKNEFAFRLYIKIHDINNFQAGIYALDQTMSVPQIIETLQTGVVYHDITITFLEGKNMRWFANKIEEETNHTAGEVYDLLENQEYIDSLIDKYWFLTDEIKNENIYYSLEGYLFPDTYTFDDEDVSIETIFETLLNQTDKVLSKYRMDMQKTGCTTHELMTIASVVEMEGIHEVDRKNIASVLYNRLNANMSLGSDVTTYYASKVEIGSRDLYQSELNAENAYNTRGPNMNGKLPIGPISSVSEASIQAAIYPNQTEYLYFVADKDGNVYFAKTNEEHEQIINTLKQEEKWYQF